MYVSLPRKSQKDPAPLEELRNITTLHDFITMGSISTLIYISELILCFTICIHSATRHNIHMYPYFLFAAIHHLNRPGPDFLCPTS